MVKFNPKLNPRHRTIKDLLTPTKQIMDKVAVEVDKDFRRDEASLFASEGTSGGPAWPQLSPAYAKQKAKKYKGRKILQRKGDLRKSLTQRKSPPHIAKAFKLENWRGQWGTQDIKATWHREAKKKRDALQHTEAQWARYLDTVQRTFIPHVARAVRSLAAWRG